MWLRTTTTSRPMNRADVFQYLWIDQDLKRELGVARRWRRAGRRGRHARRPARPQGPAEAGTIALSLPILAMLRSARQPLSPPLPSSASEIIYWRDRNAVRVVLGGAFVLPYAEGKPAHSDPVRAEDHHCPRHELSLYRAEIGEQEPEQARGASIGHVTKEDDRGPRSLPEGE